ncbi:MAG: spermidine synthase [Victivallales bacterium]
MNSIKDGWFAEICEMWPGRALNIKVTKELYNKRSKFQDIKLYETESCGKMLTLDGIIQFTESDEFAYQEMMTHPALFSHPNPRRVLVIGGGDGGILREIAKHDTVEEIDICEIDEDVINVCKEYVPSLACGFDDPRVSVHIADGGIFIKERRNYYDAIIVDSSDPIGPGEALFQQTFYEGMKSALAPEGIIAAQGESIFLHQDIVEKMMRITKSLFPVWGYACVFIPTYPGGNIGVCLGSMEHPLEKPLRVPNKAMQDKLKYYTPEIHSASMHLPAFAARLMDKVRNNR